MVSAFWHGFYPNYYVAFFLVFFVVESCKEIQRHYLFFEKVIPVEFIRHALCYFMNRYVMNFLIMVHFALLPPQTIMVLENTRFVPVIAIAITYGVTKFLIPLVSKPAKPIRKSDKDKTE